MSEKIKFLVDGRLLDHIGLAMYSSLPKAISELVANSYDADAEKVHITLPKDLSNGNIIIKDNGSGMDKAFIKNIYMNLGSKNRLQEKTPKFKRLKIGCKGIGKLAGLGIANIMKIETIKNKKRYTFEINRNQIKGQTLDSVEFPIEEDNTNETEGTTIILKDLLPHVETINEEDMRRFLAREFLSKQNFHVFVNGEEISPPEIPNVERRNIEEDIEGCGKVKGYILIADKPSTLRNYKLRAGIVTTVRGRRIFGPTLFDINSHGHWYRVAERIYGEIEVPSFDPENPTNELDEFVISTSRDGVNKNHPKYLRYKQWIEDKLIDICGRLEKEQAEERKRKLLQSSEFKKMLLRIPKEMRNDVENKVRNMIERIIPTLSELPPTKADSIIQIISKLFESSEMISLIEKIEEASKEDIKKLSKALQNWGIYEINIIIEHFRTRLMVIAKFEELIDNIKTLEYPEIHKLFEKNLWILNDEYRLYESNKSLKRAIEKEIQSKYKKHAKDRPDLIVKTSGNKVVIIELKRPAHTVNTRDYAQILEYDTIITKHSPNTSQTECFLIGNKFDEAIRNPKDEKIGRYLLSYAELLQRAKERYKEILSILDGG
ncbi:MAG TPA: hypothetical protein ENG48_07780 [Candidatus Atribacteria bacterium]|nr:hypothetical protein [Candidatus Atribacteria bacterium]